MYTLGRALRKKYSDFFDYDSKSILALTSNSQRCKDSLEATLEGFYEITNQPEKGREMAEKFQSGDMKGVSPGKGSSSAWLDVQLDPNLVPTLDYKYYASSNYIKNHPSILRKDLVLDPQIRKLPGLDRLREIITQKYGLPFTTKVFNAWSAIDCELYLDRTLETMKYMDHFADWIHEPIAEDSNGPGPKISVDLLELFEEVVLLGFLGMVDKKYDYLMMSPTINSLRESQDVALGRAVLNDRAAQYVNKKLILYSTHDSVLTMLLFDLGLIHTDGGTFVKRMLAAKRAGATNLDKYLAGLMMCNFGISLRFELWQITSANGHERPVIRLYIYNQPDPSEPVEWVPIPFGQLCKRRYAEMYPNEGTSSPPTDDLRLDETYDCPKEIFDKITAPWILDQEKYDRIYNDEPSKLKSSRLMVS